MKKRHKLSGKKILEQEEYTKDQGAVGYTHILDAVRDWDKRLRGNS